MKNLFYLVVVFGTLQMTNAQKQFKQLANHPFEGLRDGDIALSDVNADGNQDVLIIGQNNEFEEVTKLYLNTGNGNYSEVINTPFVGVELGSVAFTDVNKNGLSDVLITGLTSAGQPVAKLYINKGNGDFVEDKNNSFEGAYYSSIAFADVDSNGSEDVLIAGLNSFLKPFSKLYINDGKGNFKEKKTSFEAVSSGSIAFADTNENTHMDVLITGKNSEGKAITQLYINDGKGNFKDISTPFSGVAYGDAAFADLDGNGSMDLVLTGNANGRIAKWYKNNGQAKFEEIKNTPFEAVSLSSILIVDMNNNGYLDVMISGQNNAKVVVTKLYTNDGAGNFVAESRSTFNNLELNCMAVSKSVKHHNVFMFGQNTQGLAVSNVYRK